ncbi:hypothetical protein [Streptomyces sp. NPDC005004]
MRVGRGARGPVGHLVRGLLRTVVAGHGRGPVPESQALPPPLPGGGVDVGLYRQRWEPDSPALAAPADMVTGTAADVPRR